MENIQQQFEERFSAFREKQKNSSSTEIRYSSRTKTPQWVISETRALRDLKANVTARYKKDLPRLRGSKSAVIAQTVTDEVYYQFIVDTLDAAGADRAKDILNRITISQGIK